MKRVMSLFVLFVFIFTFSGVAHAAHTEVEQKEICKMYHSVIDMLTKLKQMSWPKHLPPEEAIDLLSYIKGSAQAFNKFCGPFSAQLTNMNVHGVVISSKATWETFISHIISLIRDHPSLAKEIAIITAGANTGQRQVDDDTKRSRIWGVLYYYCYLNNKGPQKIISRIDKINNWVVIPLVRRITGRDDPIMLRSAYKMSTDKTVIARLVKAILTYDVSDIHHLYSEIAQPFQADLEAYVSKGKPCEDPVLTYLTIMSFNLGCQIF